MDNGLLISLITLIVATISLTITLYDRLFKRAKCKIKVEASSFFKNKDNKWRVYIRFNIYTKNKPITIRSISLTKRSKGRKLYITQFEKAFNGDAFAQAKNDFLLPNTILQPDTYHRIILEQTFISDLPKKYDYEENGWVLSFSYNSAKVIRKELNMKFVGKDKVYSDEDVRTKPIPAEIEIR